MLRVGIWLDLACLRQCVSDFDVAKTRELIKRVGHTLVEVIQRMRSEHHTHACIRALVHTRGTHATPTLTHTLIPHRQLDTDVQQFLARSFCAFEAFCTIEGEAKFLPIVDLVRAKHMKALLDEHPVKIETASTRDGRSLHPPQMMDHQGGLDLSEFSETQHVQSIVLERLLTSLFPLPGLF